MKHSIHFHLAWTLIYDTDWNGVYFIQSDAQYLLKHVNDTSPKGEI